MEGSAKSCLAKFIPGSDRYEEAWKALDERFGRADTVVLAGKKRVDQLSVIVGENSERIRQNQEIVSELISIYKEHDFADELKSPCSQIPGKNAGKLPARLCGKWAEFVEGKPELSTWESFASWLERQANISESKKRWMPERREGKRPDSFKTDKPVSGLFAGATRESSSCTGDGAK